MVIQTYASFYSVEVFGYPLLELTVSQHYLRSTLACGKMPTTRDGTGQHFCSPARPEVTRSRPARTVYAKPHIIFRPGPARGP